MKKYKVKINSPNKFLIIKNRQVRTPTEFEIYENELTRIKMKIKNDFITDYSIEEIDMNNVKNKKIHILNLNELIQQPSFNIDLDEPKDITEKDSPQCNTILEKILIKPYEDILSDEEIDTNEDEG